VLHRDLKPANVLLQFGRGPPASADGICSALAGGSRLNEATPKITDFGLAKLMEGAAGTQSVGFQTESGAILGTPNYMAPEQGGGQSKLIGPPADVYSLGAVLYELLTGRPPFQADTVLETLLLVRSQEVLSPARLRPNLPRDLETICLKCLEKEPPRRYRTAWELADELHRFLGGDSIHARPTPGWERAWRWARRRPALTALALVSVVAAVAVISIVLVANARLQKEIGRTEARRLEAENNYQDAQEQHRQAMANSRKAREAVDRMLLHVGQVKVSGVPYMENVQRELFRDAVRFYEELALQPGEDPDLLLQLARARRRLGGSLVGFDEKLRSLNAARQLLTGLAANHPNVSDYSLELARCHGDIGAMFTMFGRGDEAAPFLHQARTLGEVLVAADSARPEYLQLHSETHNVLGILHALRREFSDAEQSFRKAIALLNPLVKQSALDSEVARKQAVLRSNLGELLRQSGQNREAEQLFLDSKSYWENLAAQFPTIADNRSKLALTCANLGVLYLKTGRPNDAEREFQLVARLRQKLAEEFSQGPHHHWQLGNALRELCVLTARRGNRLEACRLLDQAVGEHQIALKMSTTSPDYVRSLGADWLALADLRLELRNHAETRRAAKEFPTLLSDKATDELARATILARCVPLLSKDPELKPAECKQLEERYAELAVRLLGEAKQQGFKDFSSIKNDIAFSALKGRKDYESLLARPRGASGFPERKQTLGEKMSKSPKGK
jgi:tetratricopeptide (TPR) repeat protein